MLLRLGWLTVLSSMNIVEQELYFLLRSPGDIWKDTQMKNEDRWRQKKTSRHTEAGIPELQLALTWFR